MIEAYIHHCLEFQCVKRSSIGHNSTYYLRLVYNFLSSHSNSTLRMASRNPLQISGLIKYFKITEEQLEEECSDEHLETLSQSKRFVWKDWADQLGLSDEQIKDIDGMSLDGSGKAQTALSIWQDINGFLATYEKLAETFLGGGNAKLAGEVCKLLKGM